MKEGFYEKIITNAVATALENETDKTFVVESLKKSDMPKFVSRYLMDILKRALNQISEESDEKAKKKLIDFSNEIVQLTSRFLDDPEFNEEQISNTGDILKAFFHKSTFTQVNLKEHIKETIPITGLSESTLFTGGKDRPGLGSELIKEMRTSDVVWWLVSFLKFEGVRLFRQELQKLETAGKPVKIICTVYMGATDLKAIDFLSEFSNVEIKISFNTNQERLHAKSYMFMRNTGFDTAYIGSSNLSKSAITNGLEWNLKVTQQETPHIIKKCNGAFETYWNDSDFELYDPALHREKLQHALEKGKMKKSDDDISKFFDLSPFPFQQQILDQLQDCRERGENKNLVVAATGTGKTVISAFDFKRFLKENPTAKFLFVAHREEILRQACYTFRQVLKNNDFGDLWFSGQTPKSYNQLFVSIQTMNNRIKEIQLAPDFYDYIVIDEVHHSAASSYQSLLNYFTPKILLGLTATPERHDGEDISKYFGHAISAEIRLPDALNQKLLCPFQYFGVSEQLDISHVSWRRGRYDIAELEKIYSEDNRRVLDILRNCQKYLGDFQTVKALGYCVSKKHAEFMAKEFQGKGLKAGYLHSDNGQDRKLYVQQLRKGEINYLFVVDLFNEGVDIPEIDTLLFLRPTESLTVFLQQLGRGLRLHEDKTCLTVLDFVGQQHAEYSFEHKFRAMLGKTHTKVKEELLNDFPHLPLGCSITLEETAKETILRNIQNAYGAGEKSLLKAMERFRQDYDIPFTLMNFCEYMGIELYALYKSKQLFFELKNKLEGKDFVRNEFSEKLARAFGNTWLASDSKSYFEFVLKFISGVSVNESDIKTEQQLLMLYIDLFDAAPMVQNISELKNLLLTYFADADIKEEAIGYLSYRLEKVECIEKSISLKLPHALMLHGRYTRNQILAAFSESSLDKQASSREGVYRIKNHNTEILFVTLYKNDGKFNASTMYHDYFINDQLFHWQSQNSTAPESPVGQSYIHQRSTSKDILLFVRESSFDENGVTMGFVFCGKLNYIQHEGRKPMSITWRMETPPPALLLEEGKKLGVG
jgi:superfamily II DNA or RNA helicase